ncbi:MAG: Tyrosine recombinase XerD [Pelotomaculum sp. PtaU1.Bin065]|nr:MAG: Tyrosine recombinase XerD [Pelotomaculum sp. PtaU1.Bin065]
MPGHIEKVKGTKNKFKIIVEAGKDPLNPKKRKRIVRYHKGRESEATDIMAMIIAELEQGTVVEPNKITVSDWMETWLEEYKKPSIRAKTYDQYTWANDAFIKPYIGSLPLQKLRPEHIQKLYNSILQANKSTRLVHLIHLLLSSALKQAIKNRIIKENATDATTRPPMRSKEVRALTEEEQSRFISALLTHPYGAAFVTQLGTGLRRSELLGLHWEDIDEAINAYEQQLEKENIIASLEKEAKENEDDRDSLEANIESLKTEIIDLKRDMVLYVRRGIVYVRKQGLMNDDPKTNKSKRMVPLPLLAVTMLKQHRDKLRIEGLYRTDGPVFPGKNGGYLFPDTLNKKFNKLRDDLNFKDVNPHALRHTFATRLLELGEEMTTVQELLGHTKISTTSDIYSHVSEKLKRRAVDKLDNVLVPNTTKETPRAPVRAPNEPLPN